MNLILETERLLLRPITPSDAEGMFALDSNPNVHKYLGNNPVTSIEQIHKVIQMINEQYEKNGIGRFAVILKEIGEFIGWSGLKFVTEPENHHVNYYDIGYRLIEEHWGKGYAQESAKAWRDHAFDVMKVPAIFASAHIENASSINALQKIGMEIKEQYLHQNLPCHWLEQKSPHRGK
ncbi:GNAT family N-acetyltransferase [Flavobacterium sp. 3HN19-14]|uniref:GNAT family N-acetyltransferase n=1 Tax=Flavobacterium sp. 3HN19-14 TaxID=3448133 RepID=UPI003EE1C44D